MLSVLLSSYENFSYREHSWVSGSIPNTVTWNRSLNYGCVTGRASSPRMWGKNGLMKLSVAGYHWPLARPNWESPRSLSGTHNSCLTDLGTWSAPFKFPFPMEKIRTKQCVIKGTDFAPLGDGQKEPWSPMHTVSGGRLTYDLVAPVCQASWQSGGKVTQLQQERRGVSDPGRAPLPISRRARAFLQTPVTWTKWESQFCLPFWGKEVFLRVLWLVEHPRKSLWS